MKNLNLLNQRRPFPLTGRMGAFIRAGICIMVAWASTSVVMADNAAALRTKINGTTYSSGSLSASLSGNDVIVSGTATGQLELIIDDGVTVIWKASLSCASPAANTNYAVRAAVSNPSTGTGAFRMEAGSIALTSSNPSYAALRGTNFTIAGGQIIANGGCYAFMYSGAANMTGGSITGQVQNVNQILNTTPLTPMGGIIITSYPATGIIGTNDCINFLPSANVTVYWDMQNNIPGIYWKNGSTSGVIPISTVSLSEIKASDLTFSQTGQSFTTTYNGQGQGISGTVSYNNSSCNVSESLTVKYNNSTTLPVNAGSYAMTVNITGKDVSFGTYVINPAEITFTAPSDLVIYAGDPFPDREYVLDRCRGSATYPYSQNWMPYWTESIYPPSTVVYARQNSVTQIPDTNTPGEYVVRCGGAREKNCRYEPCNFKFTYITGKLTILRTALKPRYYSVSVGAFTGGSVKASCSEAPQGTDVYLTVSPESGYTLGSIDANENCSPHKGLHVKGSGANSYYFEMKDCDVTVTAKFYPNADRQKINEALYAISVAQFTYAQSAVNTADAVRNRLAVDINKLLPSGLSITYKDVSITSFKAAQTGVPSNPYGTNGSFAFSLTLSIGNVTGQAVKSGAITATSAASHAVTVAPTTGGAVTTTPTNAKPGEYVDVAATPSTGYELESIAAYLNGSTERVYLQTKTNTRYFFIMPLYNGVTIQATFRSLPQGNEAAGRTGGITTWSQGETLYVRGLPAGKAWMVYGLSGVLFYTGLADDSGEAQVTLPHGAYVIAAGERRGKAIH